MVTVPSVFDSPKWHLPLLKHRPLLSAVATVTLLMIAVAAILFQGSSLLLLCGLVLLSFAASWHPGRWSTVSWATAPQWVLVWSATVSSGALCAFSLVMALKFLFTRVPSLQLDVPLLALLIVALDFGYDRLFTSRITQKHPDLNRKLLRLGIYVVGAGSSLMWAMTELGNTGWFFGAYWDLAVSDPLLTIIVGVSGVMYALCVGTISVRRTIRAAWTKSRS